MRAVGCRTASQRLVTQRRVAVHTFGAAVRLRCGWVLAWRIAGYYGVDRYLLPRLGVPWGARIESTTPAPAAAG
jgi:hypothetical protein